jgi:AraC-like DNA-binding protein/Tfp pilus assembly protein PilF
MQANPERDWSPATLASIAGVSSRTMQRQFRTFLGKTPRAVLHDIRFEAARRELLRSLPDARMMDIAHRYGFTHCGRFSVEYRRRFGESPSQTLTRQTLFIDTLISAPVAFVGGRDRLTIALGPINAGAENSELARNIADELAAALTRAGVAVTRQPRSARYQLTGVVRETDRQARLALHLSEVETGRHLATHRSDDMLGDDANFDERFATRIVAALQPHLRLAEIDRAGRKEDIELSSHDLALRAMPFVLSLSADGNARALDLLERAMESDREDALATALAAWSYGQRIVYHFTVVPDEDRARGAELAQKARALAGDATVLAILGNAFTFLHDLDAATQVVRRALAIDGGSAWAWSRSGWLDVYNGYAGSAIERFRIALELAPDDSLAFNSMVGLGCAYFEIGRYVDAADWQQRALIAHPSSTWIHRTMCPAYMLAGAHSEARRSVAALRTHYPDLTISGVQQGMPPLPQSYCNLVFDTLHSAGLPL